MSINSRYNVHTQNILCQFLSTESFFTKASVSFLFIILILMIFFLSHNIVDKPTQQILITPQVQRNFRWLDNLGRRWRRSRLDLVQFLMPSVAGRPPAWRSTVKVSFRVHRFRSHTAPSVAYSRLSTCTTNGCRGASSLVEDFHHVTVNVNGALSLRRRRRPEGRHRLVSCCCYIIAF